MVFKGVGSSNSGAFESAASKGPLQAIAAMADKPAPMILRRLRKSCSEVMREVGIGIICRPC